MTYIDKEILYKNKEIKTRVYLSGCVFAIDKNYARDGQAFFAFLWNASE